MHIASKIFSALVFCFAVAALAGCDKDTPRRSLVGPTPIITPPVVVVVDVRPVDSQFNDLFWRQFVFNQYDEPSRQWGNYVLDTTSPNVYIRMGDPTGRRVVSYQQRDHITRAVPRLAQQLTGSPYRGRIESGIEDRDRTGWITVRFVTQEEEPQISDGACGRARVGGDPGAIWIIRRARGNKRCVDPSYFPEIFAHEFGHADGVLPRGRPTRGHDQSHHQRPI